MRQSLIDHARAAHAAKRQGERVDVNLEEWTRVSSVSMEDLLALDAALDRLRAISARCLDVVELRCFAGLDVDETAQVLSILRQR
jgi:DNA-directed RNA polymerase specialized sigma24 family protein